ncbi:beta-galactosidase [Microbacterium sp. KSW4-11]|uniref:Beta-galactosidase n=1 Tax=Microbacterium gawkjiense TaxID=3067309 RepID=A0ABU3G7Q1_9MICO|nr:beta-galactosidase [Microbacterium sp. KSW4-11]MDT3315844.1 beta-galactosidase [Microbacterium sp. KSW4-11]
MTTTVATTLMAEVQPWTTPLRPHPMTPAASTGPGLTNRYLTRDGAPYFPVSGEFHFTRVPRSEWDRRLRLMRNGGLTAVAAYIFWNHHQPRPDDPPAFDDTRDVAGFVDAAARAGLDVILRVGPWCHGEVRNGGFPDWVQHAEVAHRTDDPAYLALVRPWFEALGAQLAGRLGEGSPVIGIQIENELYDQPGHITTLKTMAVEAGLVAPLYMATAWGGAQLPAHEVLPMFGGYADGFWVDADAPWDDTFREHFFFTHVWDDPGIGADVRAAHDTQAPADRRPPSDEFPAVTCELGGGMATAYHRRPVLDAADIAAVANAKIGNGSAWQGYYMYAGGLNPGPGLQESLVTAYPNDMPEYDYDFHAPIGAAGRPTRTHALLRTQHAFLRHFGSHLVQMPSTLPDSGPRDVRDGSTPRWAVRSDGTTGVVFVNWQQPHDTLDDISSIRFHIRTPERDLVFPDEPIGIPRGTVARFPFGLSAGQTLVDWATASPLALLDRPGGGSVLVLLAHEGIPPRVQIGGEVREATGSTWAWVVGDDAVVVLASEHTFDVWLIDDQLYLSRDELDVDPEGVIAWARTGDPVRRFDLDSLRVRTLEPTGPDVLAARDLAVVAGATGAGPAATYGAREGRAAAPGTQRVIEDGDEYTVEVPADLRAHALEVTIDWIGDVAVVHADGVILSDRFWDGTPWTVRVPAGTSRLTLHVLGFHPDAAVWLHPVARRRLAEAPSHGVTSVRAQAADQRRRHR